MGVNSDLLNAPPFQRGGISSISSPALKIRQQANNARAKGLNQIRAFKQMTETGGIQAKQPEATEEQVGTPYSQQHPQQLLSPKAAGELLRTHSKLIDELVGRIMFG